MPDQKDKSKFIFEPLNKHYDRAAFSCGVSALDTYLHNQAGQDIKKHAAAVCIMTHDGKTIAGYYTLSQYAVELDVIPLDFAKKFPKYPQVPATLLGRLAVSTAFHGQGAGVLLLVDALRRCYKGSKQIASAAVVVDAKDETAAAFYRKYGFFELPKIKNRLFLPMGTIEKLFAGE